MSAPKKPDLSAAFAQAHKEAKPEDVTRKATTLVAECGVLGLSSKPVTDIELSVTAFNASTKPSDALVQLEQLAGLLARIRDAEGRLTVQEMERAERWKKANLPGRMWPGQAQKYINVIFNTVTPTPTPTPAAPATAPGSSWTNSTTPTRARRTDGPLSGH